MLQHVVNSLSGKELIGMGGLTQTIKEEREVVVVVQLLNLHLNVYIDQMSLKRVGPLYKDQSRTLL